MKTLKDVAKAAGVSEGTASLALNQRKGVNAETRRRVLDAASRIGYLPNRIARGLATRKTNTIGFVVTEIENPFFAALARNVHELVRAAGYNLMMSMSNEDVALEDEILEQFIGVRVEAVIVVPTLGARKSFDAFDALAQHQIPCVFATAYYPGREQGIDCVMTDLEEGAYRLTRYLLDLGHHEILFTSVGDLEAIPARDRYRGFQRAMAERSGSASGALSAPVTGADYLGGYRLGRSLVRTGLPHAIIALNDILALGISAAIRESGARVPEDVSVCGYDDVIFSSISEVPLTTVRQDIEGIAREAVRLAVGRIEGKGQPPEIVRLRPDLVVRQSTAPRRERTERTG